MKKYLSLIAITFALASCEQYLDKAPNQGYTEGIIFNDYQSVRGYFDKSYDLINDYLDNQSQGMNRHYKTGEMSDEGGNVYKITDNLGNKINKGIWLGENDICEVGWNDKNSSGVMIVLDPRKGRVIPQCFLGIRISNRILEKVPEMADLTDGQRNELIGQAYFFRGWFYFEVIRRLGGMPPLTRLFYSFDDGNMARLTYGESSDLIIEDMDKAIELLPHKWDESQTGRPTKSSAYALKSMAELYSASPLMRNGINETKQYTDYDPDRVVLAARYAKECLDYIYKTNKDTYDQTMMSMAEYPNIFYHPAAQFVSQESLWYKNYCGANREGDLTALWQCVSMSGRLGNMGTPNFCPNQTIIDKFETINGYKVELTKDGWVGADPAFDRTMPYKDRDPRLYHFILLPGERFGTRAASHGSSTDNTAFYLATWEGGNESKIQGNNEGGRGDILTRYLVKKYQWPTSNNGKQGANNPNYKNNSYNSIFIRTTQVWLDYAEAMNEAYGPDVKPAGYDYSAVEALNMVRNRVGQCNVRSEYIVDKETFRDKIRDERAIELFCENHRWFDIRRWMIAEKVLSVPSPIKGVTVQISGTSIDKVWFPPGATEAERGDAKYGKYFSYTLIGIPEEVRVFRREHYWYPMRKDEVNRYPEFKQNPGW